MFYQYNVPDGTKKRSGTITEARININVARTKKAIRQIKITKARKIINADGTTKTICT